MSYLVKDIACGLFGTWVLFSFGTWWFLNTNAVWRKKMMYQVLGITVCGNVLHMNGSLTKDCWKEQIILLKDDSSSSVCKIPVGLKFKCSYITHGSFGKIF